MGQCASLYRIDKSDFAKAIDNPDGFSIREINKGYEIFDSSFEGLQFVLLKAVDDTNSHLVKLIFDPTTFIGEEIDLSTIDFENLSDDIDLLKQPLYYHEPARVSAINNLLEHISLVQFQNLFDHNELNSHEVYPGNIWNDSTHEDSGFNMKHMTDEFENLKTIFKTASGNAEYLLVYVG